MSRTRRFPNLGAEEWAAVCAEFATGIICMTDGRRALPEDQPYRIFPSRAAAEEFAFAVIQAHPWLECALYDRDAPAVIVHRNDEFVQKLLADANDEPATPGPGPFARLLARLRRR